MSEPKLLRVPHAFHSVGDVIETARQLNLSSVLVLSEREDGSIVLLDSGLTCAQVNWLADRAKQIVLGEKPQYADQTRPAG